MSRPSGAATVSMVEDITTQIMATMTAGTAMLEEGTAGEVQTIGGIAIEV